MTYRIPTLKTTLKRGALLFASLALFAACGQADRSALGSSDIVNPDVTSTRQNVDENGTFVLSFGDAANPGRPMAFKSAIGTTSKQHVTKFIGKKGGTMKVKFPKTKIKDVVGVSVKQAQFTVKANSISKPSRIGMTVYSGTVLKDVKVIFSPSGLAFDPTAILKVHLLGHLTSEELESLTAYHVSGDGKVSKTRSKVQKKGSTYIVHIAVPGFSSYGLGGDDDGLPPETGP